MFRNSFESKKHKLKTKAFVDKKQDASRPSSPLRQTNSSFVNTFSKPTQSSQTLRKAVEQISLALSEEKEMRAALQQKVTLIFTRSIQRQRQFQSLLQETIPFCKNQQKMPMSSQSYEQVHNKILEFFKFTNTESQKQQQQKQKELEGIMTRKIRKITDHMEQQLAKSKKMLKLNHQTITRQIKQIITLSHSILDENDAFRKKHNDLLLKNQMLRQEKKLLITQTLEKKGLILKLFDQLKQKYNKDDLINEEIMVLKKQRKQVEKQYQEYQREIRSKLDCQDQIRAKSIYAFRAEDNFVMNPTKKIRPASKYITTQCSYNVSCQSTGKRQSKSKQDSRLITTIEAKDSYEASRRSFYPNKTQTIATTECFDKEDQKIKELRLILRNQRRKNSELTKRLNKQMIYQQQMDSLLKDIFLNEDEKIPEDPSVFKHSGKIYHMVKELGRRLMSSSNPAINSGYNDLNNLLEEFQEEKKK